MGFPAHLQKLFGLEYLKPSFDNINEIKLGQNRALIIYLANSFSYKLFLNIGPSKWYL